MYFSGDETSAFILTPVFYVSYAVLAVSSKIEQSLLKSIFIFTLTKPRK